MDRLILAVLLGATVWLLPTNGPWRAGAQEEPQVIVERPLPGTSVSVQTQISGWAVDPSGPGTGIDAVHVYLDGEPGQPRARFLGAASYGLNRPDVARTLGDQRFTRSGYSLVADLPPGNHTIFVYAHSSNAGPQEGWIRASVGQFEASSIAPGATMVQPGPAATSDDGRYRTGQASWQGGNTCLRYSGSGSCEASIPHGIASGASCIQWNQRGQCTSYLPAEGASVAGSSGASAPAPTRAPGASGTAPLSVPTASAPRPPVAASAAVRAAAPPAPASEEVGEEAPPAEEEAPPARPVGALPAAPPPGISSAVRAAAPPPAAAAAAPPSSVGDAPAARAVAPAPATAPTARPDVSSIVQRPGSAMGDSQSDSPTFSRGSSAPAPVTGTPPEGPSDLGAPPSGPVPAYVPPTAIPVAPQVVATQQALQGGGSSSVGVSGLRSGCALYLGCGPATPTPSYNTGSPLLAGGASPAGSAGGAAPSAASVAPGAATGAAPAVAAAPAMVAGAAALLPTPTPTACPPQAPCGPVVR